MARIGREPRITTEKKRKLGYGKMLEVPLPLYAFLMPYGVVDPEPKLMHYVRPMQAPEGIAGYSRAKLVTEPSTRYRVDVTGLDRVLTSYALPINEVTDSLLFCRGRVNERLMSDYRTRLSKRNVNEQDALVFTVINYAVDVSDRILVKRDWGPVLSYHVHNSLDWLLELLEKSSHVLKYLEGQLADYPHANEIRPARVYEAPAESPTEVPAGGSIESASVERTAPQTEGDAVPDWQQEQSYLFGTADLASRGLPSDVLESATVRWRVWYQQKDLAHRALASRKDLDDIVLAVQEEIEEW